VDSECIARRPFGGGADRTDQFDQGFSVANARHVVEDDRMLGEQGCRNDRQRRVLVAGRLNRTGEALAALDNILDGRHDVP
jgi:hypothetical protein